MSCCSLKVAGSNPVLGNFLKKKFHRGGAFKAFFKTRTQCLGQLESEGGVNSILDHLYRDTG